MKTLDGKKSENKGSKKALYPGTLSRGEKPGASATARINGDSKVFQQEPLTQEQFDNIVGTIRDNSITPPVVTQEEYEVLNRILEEGSGVPDAVYFPDLDVVVNLP